MPSTKFFSPLNHSGALEKWGENLTTSVSTIEPGLLVVLDAAGRTVSLAEATGSAPFGFAYGNRDLIYAPTTKTFDNGEDLTVITGRGYVAVSADFFASGSLPGENEGQSGVWAGAAGKMTVAAGTNRIGALVDTVTWRDPLIAAGGGNASVAIIHFDFGVTP